MPVPFLLVRVVVDAHARLVEVTLDGDHFRIAGVDGVHRVAPEDVVEHLLQPFEQANPTADADVIVIGCDDDEATPCVVAVRRAGFWHDLTDDVTGPRRAWADVRCEIVAALATLVNMVGRHAGARAMEHAA